MESNSNLNHFEIMTTSWSKFKNAIIKLNALTFRLITCIDMKYAPPRNPTIPITPLQSTISVPSSISDMQHYILVELDIENPLYINQNHNDNQLLFQTVSKSMEN